MTGRFMLIYQFSYQIIIISNSSIYRLPFSVALVRVAPAWPGLAGCSKGSFNSMTFFFFFFLCHLSLTSPCILSFKSQTKNTSFPSFFFFVCSKETCFC